MRKILAFCTALALGTSGCAAFVSALPKVIAAVTDALQVVDAIEDFVKTYFQIKPNGPLEMKVDAAIKRTKQALNLALRTTNGADKLSQDQIDAAFAEFRAAYAELLNLVEPLGVHQKGEILRASPDGGGLVVPEPMALKLKV